jgi:putative two-component system response regulator
MPDLLLVDDEDALRRWGVRVLERQRYTVTAVPDVPSARSALAEGSFELALLDFNLPGESGLELLAEIRADHADTAVLMVTGEDDISLATAAIELGAFGYLVKPVSAGELIINVTSALHRRAREADMMRRLARLESDRTQAEHELRSMLNPRTAVGDAVRLLESDTVHRLLRMSRYCELVALALGLDEGWSAEFRLAAELHDVGKVAIPDRILLKPGRLTDTEREVMQTHAEIGHRLLSDADSELLQTAATVALTHHERYDGTGYPRALARDEIPVEGRIAAVADVFDALTSDRVYRPAFPVGLAIEMMEAERERHFDPAILEALQDTFERVDAVRRAFSD